LSGFPLRSELFRQERAGSSERSEKPDKRKEKEERGKIPAVRKIPAVASLWIATQRPRAMTKGVASRRNTRHDFFHIPNNQ
jgi:hypothetical protein